MLRVVVRPRAAAMVFTVVAFACKAVKRPIYVIFVGVKCEAQGQSGLANADQLQTKAHCDSGTVI